MNWNNRQLKKFSKPECRKNFKTYYRHAKRFFYLWKQENKRIKNKQLK